LIDELVGTDRAPLLAVAGFVAGERVAGAGMGDYGSELDQARADEGTVGVENRSGGLDQRGVEDGAHQHVDVLAHRFGAVGDGEDDAAGGGTRTVPELSRIGEFPCIIIRTGVPF
jgi:hypothetical protein